MKYKFTKTDRMRIVHEYETSDLTYAELAKKYGLSSASIVAKWRDRLQNSSKNVTAKKLGIPIISEEEFKQKFLT